MSFGYAVSDIVGLSQLAWKTVQNSRRACGEQDELTREVTSLHFVLRRLEQEVSTPTSLINQPNNDRREELESSVDGCGKVLSILVEILEKYNALSESGRAGRKLWSKVRFGNGEMQDLSELRIKVLTYTSAITLLLNLLSMSSTGRIEQHMNSQGLDLREMRQSLNWITASLSSSHEGSMLTSYAGDNKAVWKELRRELIKEGHSSEVISRNKSLIMEYIKELGERGALDELLILDDATPVEDLPSFTDEPLPSDLHPSPNATPSTVPAEILFPSPDFNEFEQILDRPEADETGTSADKSQYQADKSLSLGDKGTMDASVAEFDEIAWKEIRQQFRKIFSNAQRKYLKEAEVQASMVKIFEERESLFENHFIDEASHLTASGPNSSGHPTSRASQQLAPESPPSRETSKIERVPSSVTPGIIEYICSQCNKRRYLRGIRLKCGHEWCKVCLASILLKSLSNLADFPPTCCTSDYIPLNIFTNPAFKKLRDQKIEDVTMGAKSYCPQEGCGHYIKPWHVRKESGREHARCTRCKKRMCIACNGVWHPWSSDLSCAREQERAEKAAKCMKVCKKREREKLNETIRALFEG